MPGVRAATEHAHVGRIERSGQVDESAAIRQDFGALLWIGFMQAGGAADAGDAQAVKQDFVFRLRDAFRSKCRVRRQVQITFQAAKFDGSEAMLLREGQDFLQVPGRTTQSGKRNRQTRRFPGGNKCDSHRRSGELLCKFSSRCSHGASPPAVAGASLPVRWKSVKGTNSDGTQGRFPKDGIRAIGCYRNIWIRETKIAE